LGLVTGRKGGEDLSTIGRKGEERKGDSFLTTRNGNKSYNSGGKKKEGGGEERLLSILLWGKGGEEKGFAFFSQRESGRGRADGKGKKREASS